MATTTKKQEDPVAFVATVRESYTAMSTWYNNNNNNNRDALAALHTKYGSTYPPQWKDVLNWAGWDETRTLYLQQQEQQDPSTTTNETTATTTASAEPQPPAKRIRKSRWGNSEGGGTTTTTATSTASTNNNNNTTTADSQVQQWQAELRALNAKIDNVVIEAARVDALPHHDRTRSPSPPPIYGPDGKRQNTRAVRWKERYTAHRQELLEKLLQHSNTTAANNNNNGGGGLLSNPLLLGTAASAGGGRNNNPMMNALSLLRPTKSMKKIPIPIDQHPNYNFIGLIIGPRGKTQKELEAKTGCKIAIRGKGSVKEGARGRRDGVADASDYEPLHVVVSGDDPRAVDAAATMISDMLVVIDDERNVHKQQQLRELALLNGTLKDEELQQNVYCPICAEKGHRAFECPKRFNNTNNNSNKVKCANCGDTSHPTRDCKLPPRMSDLNNNIGSAQQQQDQQQVDSDYQSFMAELDGRTNNTTASTTNTSNTNGAPTLPPPPPSDLPPPPPPSGLLPPLPPPPGGLLPPPPLPPSSTLPPPPSLPPSTLLPPPPSGAHPPPPYLPPPPPSAQHPPTPYNYYQNPHVDGGSFPPPPSHPPQDYPPYHQQQQPQHASYYGGGGAPPPHDPVAAAYHQQQPPQPTTAVNPGEETAVWDPNAYYGSGANAGALNWWEQ